jgi:hypothetical protein
MSSTSTGKLPLLIDRPLLRVRKLDQSSSTPTIDPGTGTTGVLLVDCTQNDGALIEHIWLIQRIANNRNFVNLYLSTSSVALGVTATGGQADSYFVAQDRVPLNATVGVLKTMELPLLLAPVPHAAPGTGSTLVPQFRGLRIEKGWALWASCDGTGPHPDAPNIGCQGGFY